MYSHADNLKIAEFMGLDVLYGNSVHHESVLSTQVTIMKYHYSWNWLMPVVRKIVEYCCDENVEAFMSDQYTSILDTVPLAVIEDAYKVVVEFIEYYNTFK